MKKTIKINDNKATTDAPVEQGMKQALEKFMGLLDSGTDKGTTRREAKMIVAEVHPVFDNPIWTHFVEYAKKQELDLDDMPGEWFEQWEAFYAGAQIGATLCAQSMTKFSDGVDPDAEIPTDDGDIEKMIERTKETIGQLQEVLKKARKRQMDNEREQIKKEAEEEKRKKEIGSKNAEELADKKPDEFDDSNEFPPGRNKRII